MLLVQALRQIRESDLSLTEGDATLVVETPTGGGGKGSAVSACKLLQMCWRLVRACAYNT